MFYADEGTNRQTWRK